MTTKSKKFNGWGITNQFMYILVFPNYAQAIKEYKKKTYHNSKSRFSYHVSKIKYTQHYNN